MKTITAQPGKQNGVAIILAMSVVAFAALAAMTMVVAQSTWTRRIELRNDHVQALLVARGGMDWARAVLSDDSRASNVDYIGEAWSIKLPPLPIEQGSLSGNIEDQQGKYNLNNLVRNGKVNPRQLANFQRLLGTLGLSAELADKLAMQYPLDDVTGLAAVPGFNDAVRTRLRPYVTVLPQFTAINVNTASPEVLSAIIDGLTIDDARMITAQRERNYFRTLTDFSSLLPGNLVIANEDIAVNSHYFIVTMLANTRDGQAKGSALLFREHTDLRVSNNWPTVIWSKFQ